MKKKILCILGVLSVSVLTVGCNGKDPSSESNNKAEERVTSETGNENVGLANPWIESSELEACSIYSDIFQPPKGAENIYWSILFPEDGESGQPVVQLNYTLEDGDERLNFCARAKETADEDEDISGMYYDWTVTDDGIMTDWGEGNVSCESYRYIGEDETADLITWYDEEIQMKYSLSTSVDSPDGLDGFDIQAVAESMHRTK